MPRPPGQRRDSDGFPGDPDDLLLALLRGRGPLSVAQMAEAIGIDRTVVSAAMLRLRRRGAARLCGLTDRGRAWGDGGPAGIWEAVTEA